MIDHTKVKLGKHAPRIDERTLKLARYLTPGLPPAPSIVDWTPPGISWGAMANDSIGDCTCAGFGHGIQVWTGNNGAIVTPSDADVIGMYSAISGYDPRTGRNDNGCNELDVMNYMAKIGLSGYKIGAYASIEAGNSQLDLPTFQQTIYCFAFSYIGIQLPTAWQGKNVWDVYGPLSNHQNQPGSWGGHAVIVVGYIDQGGALKFKVVTWGALIDMTPAAAEAYIDEAYGIIAPSWFTNNTAPNAIDMTALNADLQAVRAA